MLTDMLKSEEHAQEILVSQLNSEKRARRAAEKKAHDAELRISTLLDKVNDLQSRLDEQLGKVTELVSQMTAMFMGHGAVSLSDSIKESLVGAIRAEFDIQKQELIASFNREKQELLLRLAAKDNEIAMLRRQNQDGRNDTPTTLDKPLQNEITSDSNMHSDESTIKSCDSRLPGKGEAEDDVEPEEHYFKRWIFCHSCLVYMRRPLYKLKHVSVDARQLVDIIDKIFHRDKKIKKEYQHPDDIKRERNLRLAPLFNDLKQELDRLHNLLDPKKEPELLKAVKYVQTEYPCILHCLEDGLVDLSNNCCERQIRRIAKYRNNSFFVGSPESGVRFARLQSVFANIRNHKLNAVAYLCDVFRRIGKTAKEELVNLLPHKWQPMIV